MKSYITPKTWPRASQAHRCLIYKAPIFPLNCLPVRTNISLGSAFGAQPITSIVLTQPSLGQIELLPRSPLREQSTQSSQTLPPIATTNITVTWKSQTAREWTGPETAPSQPSIFLERRQKGNNHQSASDRAWTQSCLLIPRLVLLIHCPVLPHRFLKFPFTESHCFTHFP